MVPQLHGKYAINLVKINPEKNTAIMDEQSNTQIEPFCVILTNFWAKKNFSKKFGSVNVILRKMLRLLAKNKLSHLGTFSFSPSVLSTYNPTTSYKISEKKLMSQSQEKNSAVMGKLKNQGIFEIILAFFQTSKNFLKKLGSLSSEYLWSLNIIYYMRQI